MGDLTDEGVKAFRAGDKTGARANLIQAVKQSPDSERAWGWLYNVANNDQERIHCLEQVLRINPKNEKASQTLSQLNGANPPLEVPQDAVKTSRPGLAPWQKVLIWIGAGTVGLICLWNLCIFAVTVSGPLVNAQFERINSTLSPSTSTPKPVANGPAIAQTPTAKFDVLPVGSNLQYTTWSLHVDSIEIKEKITSGEDVYYPKNGRYAILHLSVMNTGYAPEYFIPTFELGILDGKGGAFASDIALTSSENFNEKQDYSVKANPRDTIQTLLVFDISSSGKMYLLTYVTSGDSSGVLLDMP